MMIIFSELEQSIQRRDWQKFVVRPSGGSW